jgi:hypothetical protein
VLTASTIVNASTTSTSEARNAEVIAGAAVAHETIAHLENDRMWIQRGKLRATPEPL